MIALLQRVTEAAVEIDGETIAAIGTGLLVLVGVERDDSEEDAVRMAERLCNYRVFADADGRMNLSVQDVDGEILLVPQFTLAADTSRGNRPGFSRAADPDVGIECFNTLVAAARQKVEKVACGRFGADMAVHLVNDGPVTFSLRVPDSG
jgi:D-tyrosyl-tRNA(Tyr) deacylase